MIRRVVSQKTETIARDNVANWIKQGTVGPLDKHIVIGVAWNKPFILKILPNDRRGDEFAFFSLENSKMNMSGSNTADNFIEYNLGQCDEIYVLDGLKDLAEFLKRFE